MGKGAITKGYILADGTLKSFIYNPEEFEYGYSTEYASVKPPGSPHPVYQFVGGNERTITTTLLIDGREKGTGVVAEWEEFMGKFHPANSGYNSFNPPPWAMFAIGTFVKKVIIRDVNFRYILWDKQLNPLRAELDLTMETIM